MMIAVVAGTPVDTKMGVAIMEKEGYETLSYPMAKTPEDQTQLQYFSQEDLDRAFQDRISQAKEKGAQGVYINCNSLSASLHYQEAEEKIGLPIITPLETYRNLPKDLTSVVVLAANGVSAYSVDEIIRESQPDIKTVCMGNLSIVESIEKEKDSSDIVRDLNLKGLLSYFEGIQDPDYQVDAIILACTHFPYIKEALQKETSIPIIDPKDDMVNRLKQALKARK